jgi:Ca2+-binding RTX toxin-like protein
LTIKGDWAPGNHTVSVSFLNDAWGGTPTTDRNLYVESATYNGAAVAGSNLDFFSGGTKQFTIADTTTKSSQAPSAPAPIPSNPTTAPAPSKPAPVPAPTQSQPDPAPESGPGKSMTGTDKQDIMQGTDVQETFNGGKGIDVIVAGGGNDTILGGADKDWMAGQSGDDVFKFTSLSDSKVGTDRDVICDWGFGNDKIDLGLIDANSALAGNQAFSWLGTEAFAGHAGDLHVRQEGSTTIVEGDVDGNSVADFQIQINGKVSLSGTDFIL